METIYGNFEIQVNIPFRLAHPLKASHCTVIVNRPGQYIVRSTCKPMVSPAATVSGHVVKTTRKDERTERRAKQATAEDKALS